MTRSRIVLPTVSDHALLRYLERVHHVDTQGLKRHIARTCLIGVEAGAPHVLAEGARFVLRNNRVVTVLDMDMVPTFDRIGRD